MNDVLTETHRTHSEECYRWHHRCAIAEVERLRLAHKGLKIALSDCELALQKMSAKRMDAADEVTRLREALRNISLASQNSMSSKEECGSIARAALDTEDLEE